jgi:hypothetical protein
MCFRIVEVVFFAHDLLIGIVFGLKTHHQPRRGKQQGQYKQMQAFKLMLI